MIFALPSFALQVKDIISRTSVILDARLRRAQWYGLVLIAALLTAASSCRREAIVRRPSAGPREVQFEGRNPSVHLSAGGTLHVTYIIDANERARVYYRRIPGRAVPVSPEEDRVEARGEVGPPIAEEQGGQLLTVYAVTVPGKWNSELRAQISRDGGRSWSSGVRINDDSRPGPHGYADLTVTRAGDVVVSWLDQRAGQQGAMSTVLRGDGRAERNVIVDPMTCECCRTNLLAAADGTVWLAYRDLSREKLRNIAYAISIDGGATFTPRGDIADDHWIVDGCPESGPRLVQDEHGKVWATWFNGAANAIEVAQWRAGAFTTPLRIAQPDGAITVVNHPEIGTLPDGRVVVFYEATRRDGSRTIDARIARRDGEGWSNAVTITVNGITPRYARSHERAVLAFTRYSNGKPSVFIIDPTVPLGAGRS